MLSVIFEDYKLDAVDQTRLLEMAMVKEKASFLTKLKAQRYGRSCQRCSLLSYYADLCIPLSIPTNQAEPCS